MFFILDRFLAFDRFPAFLQNATKADQYLQNATKADQYLQNATKADQYLQNATKADQCLQSVFKAMILLFPLGSKAQSSMFHNIVIF